MFCEVMVACLIRCTGPRAQLHVDTEWKHVQACATIRHPWMEGNFALGIYMKCKIVWEPIVQVCSWFFFLILLIWIVLFLVNILYVRADTETLDVKYLQIKCLSVQCMLPELRSKTNIMWFNYLNRIRSKII